MIPMPIKNLRWNEREREIMRAQRDLFLTHSKVSTKTQSNLVLYVALHRENTVAEYLTTVTDPNLRKVLTMYRLSEHSLSIERGRHRQSSLESQPCLCAHALHEC